MERDPVCGMTVDPAKAAAKVAYAGKTYYFCAKGCAARFDKDPAKFLGAAKDVAGNPTAMDVAAAGPHHHDAGTAVAPLHHQPEIIDSVRSDRGPNKPQKPPTKNSD